jgi:hypothetical protein
MTRSSPFSIRTPYRFKPIHLCSSEPPGQIITVATNVSRQQQQREYGLTAKLPKLICIRIRILDPDEHGVPSEQESEQLNLLDGYLAAMADELGCVISFAVAYDGARCHLIHTPQSLEPTAFLPRLREPWKARVSIEIPPRDPGPLDLVSFAAFSEYLKSFVSHSP